VAATVPAELLAPAVLQGQAVLQGAESTVQTMFLD
jgi:hypothetical protein